MARRIMPLLVILYFISFLDRTNVGFAALHMNDDLGISSAIYGLGAGIFFLGYFIFEVPSNVALHRFGARKWISRIAVSWGLIGLLMAFMRHAGDFLVLRFLLGVAEAGFYPGIIFFLSLWFPSKYRARMIAIFYLAVPLSQVIGSPLSAALIDLGNRIGVEGWRLMYAIESIPAIVLGIFTYFYLTDSPAKAKWLQPAQRRWLQTELEEESRLASLESGGKSSTLAHVRSVMANKTVWALALIYFGISSGTNAMYFFFPMLLESFGGGLSIMQTGLITAIPYAVAAIVMVVVSRHSDRVSERRKHMGISAIVAGVAVILGLVLNHPVVIVVGFVIMASGIYSAIVIFWSAPSQLLKGVSAAAGIGFINAVGNLSGFTGTYMTGGIKSITGSFTPAFILIALFVIAAGVWFIMLPAVRKLDDKLSTIHATDSNSKNGDRPGAGASPTVSPTV
ncbi:MFS transporter [Rhodococcus sp. NPDC057529]|uniref:MFS transporter n=1 Tax=Rhodococcus sp. NPDC057529 TaxID=3346158 RepID=UPI00367333F7